MRNFTFFPELTDILLHKQSKTSGGYWHKHKVEWAVYSPNLGFQKSMLRAIDCPLLSKIFLVTGTLRLFLSIALPILYFAWKSHGQARKRMHLKKHGFVLQSMDQVRRHFAMRASCKYYTLSYSTECWNIGTAGQRKGGISQNAECRLDVGPLKYWYIATVFIIILLTWFFLATI